MNQALETWKKKLDYLQQQEAIASDPGQKFTLAEQIKEAKAKLAELEAAANQSASVSFPFRADISRILKYAPRAAPCPCSWRTFISTGHGSLECGMRSAECGMKQGSIRGFHRRLISPRRGD